MQYDRSFWEANCRKSGEQIARETGQDGGNVRRAMRRAKSDFPDLPWRDDPRHVTTEPPAKTNPPRTISPAHSDEVPTTCTVIASDFHVPFHDPRAVSIFLGYLADEQPDEVIINGDFLDCYALSKFSKDPKRELLFQEELDEANAILDQIDEVAPNARKRFVEGNHEARIARYLKDNARALAYLRCLELKHLLRLDERGWDFVPMVGRDASCFVGKVEVGHFDRVSKHSGYTARALVEDRGVPLVQGHVHRLGSHYKRKRGNGEMLGGWECGCLCDLNPEYVTRPDWHQGFVTIRTCGSGRFHVAVHEILGGELLVGNRRY